MDTIVINPQLIGDWRNALVKDSAVAAMVQNNSNNGSWNQATLDAFAASPATGCASILEIARVQSGYNPLDPTQVQNENAMLKWINQIKTSISATLFTQEYGNQVSIGGTSDWPSYVKQAINTYIGISDTDKSRLQMSIQNLVQAAYSSPNKPEIVIMVQHTIQANTDGTISIYFYFTSALIQYSVGSGKNATSSLGSTFNIYRAKLNLNMDEYQARAKQIANTKIELVKNWLDNISRNSLNNEETIQMSALHSMSCFETIPSIDNAKTIGSGDDYWRGFSWFQLPLNAQQLWSVFGWNQINWDGTPSGYPASYHLLWNQLLPKEKTAAQLLGYNVDLWNGPSVSEATLQPNMFMYWKQYDWISIPPHLQTLWVELGWDNNNWSGNGQMPSTAATKWINLTLEQQKAAGLLGFSAGNWVQV